MRLRGSLGVVGLLLLSATVACPSVRENGEPPTEGGPREDGSSDGPSGPDGGAEGGRDAKADGNADAGGDAGSTDAAECEGSTCPLETLVTGLNQATLVRVDDDNVYFGDEGTITGLVYQCPKTGCATPMELGQGFATGMGVDATRVYWNDFSGGSIVSCAIGGCSKAPTVLAPDQVEAEGLSFDGTNLYWASSGTIATCVAPACSTVSPLATGQSTTITDVASETGVGYWVSGGSVQSCAAAGCGAGPKAITTTSEGGPLVVKNGFVYFASGNAVVSCPTTSDCAIPQTVGSSFAPYGLGTDGVDVYWLDEVNPGVYRCPVTGCLGSAVTFSMSENPSQPGANVALDGEYAYWTEPQAVFRKHK